jgi:hypothetical protein
MTDSTDIKYKTLDIEDVNAHASGDIGILVLKTDQGRVGLHMSRALLVRLGDEIKHALEREVPPSPHQ